MSSPRPRTDIRSALTPERPAIWVNGQQRPSFDITSYATYSLIATRAALGPALTRASAATQGLQARLLAGAFPVSTERLGRAAAYLPTRPGIAATVGGIAMTLQDVADVVSPPPPPQESLSAYDALWRTRKVTGRARGVDLDAVQSDPDLRALREDLPLRPTRPVRPVLVHTSPAPPPPPVAPAPEPVPAVVTAAPVAAHTAAEPDGATLMAIRSLLDDPAPQPEPEPSPGPLLLQTVAAAAPSTAATSMPPAPHIRKPLPAWTRPLQKALRRGAAFAIGWALIVLVLPIGLTKAAIAHLDGRDLRDLVEDP